MPWAPSLARQLRQFASSLRHEPPTLQRAVPRAALFCSLSLAALVSLLAACAAPSVPAPPERAPAAPAAPSAASTPGDAQAPAAAALAPLASPLAVRFASTAINANQTPLWVARDQGLFLKYGLNVEVPQIGASTVWQAAMTNGEIDYAQTGLPGVSTGVLAGADRVAIGAVVNQIAAHLYSAPEITSVRDLAGKGIANTRFGSNSDMATRLRLPQLGLQPDTDVRMLQTGGFPEAWAALRSGAVVAAYLDPPQSFEAEDAGFRKLAPIEVDLGPTQVVTTRAFVQAKPDVQPRVLAALMEAVHLMVSDAPLALEAYRKQLGIDSREVLERTYQASRDRYQRDLLPSRAAAENVLTFQAQEHPQAASLTYETLVDTAPLQQLWATGLYERLYGEPRPTR